MEWPVPPPQPLQTAPSPPVGEQDKVTPEHPCWTSNLGVQGRHPCPEQLRPVEGLLHLLKVDLDTFYSSIFFLMLWKQLHVTEAFKMLPFI